MRFRALLRDADRKLCWSLVRRRESRRSSRHPQRVPCSRRGAVPRRFARRMLLPALVASATGYLALATVDGTERLFPISGTPPLSMVDLGAAAVARPGGQVRSAPVRAWMLVTSETDSAIAEAAASGSI